MQADKEILERLRARDVETQLWVHQRYGPQVRAACEHLLDDTITAEQASVDIMTDFLFVHVDRMRSANAIGAYLRMAAVRRCVRIRELQKRHDDIGDLVPSTDENQEDLLLGAMDNQAPIVKMLDCLQHLQQKPQRMLRLRFGHGQTLEGVGQSLGVSKQYVSRVINKSLKALRRCMEAAS